MYFPVCRDGACPVCTGDSGYKKEGSEIAPLLLQSRNELRLYSRGLTAAHVISVLP